MVLTSSGSSPGFLTRNRAESLPSGESWRSTKVTGSTKVTQAIVTKPPSTNRGTHAAVPIRFGVSAVVEAGVHNLARAQSSGPSSGHQTGRRNSLTTPRRMQ